MTIAVSAVSAAPPQKKKSAPAKHAAAAHHVVVVVHHGRRHYRAHRLHIPKVARVRTIPTGAETSLIGVTLFDKGVHVLAAYGSPDTISPANVAQQINSGQGGPGGPGGTGPAFGGGGGRRPNTMGPAGAAGGGGGARGGAAGADSIIPEDDSFGNEMLGQVAINPGGGGGGQRGGPPGGFPGGPPPGMGPGGPGMGGPGMGRPGGPAGGPGGRFGGPGGPGAGGQGRFGGPGGGGNSGGAAADNVVYTRWGYTHGPSRYSFVLDKYNRVVQIEAIGIEDSRVHTRRGIHFGSSFKSIIDTYGPPDGYDIAGDNSLTVRYLINAKVAFRLSRLGPQKPPVVTGIVIAAAKG